MTEWLNQTEDSKCVQSSGYIVWFNVEMKSKLTQSETWNYCLMFNVWDVVSPARWTKKNKVSSESCLLFGNIWVKKKKKYTIYSKEEKQKLVHWINFFSPKWKLLFIFPPSAKILFFFNFVFYIGLHLVSNVVIVAGE